MHKSLGIPLYAPGSSLELELFVCRATFTRRLEEDRWGVVYGAAHAKSLRTNWCYPLLSLASEQDGAIPSLVRGLSFGRAWNKTTLQGVGGEA